MIVGDTAEQGRNMALRPSKRRVMAAILGSVLQVSVVCSQKRKRRRERGEERENEREKQIK